MSVGKVHLFVIVDKPSEDPARDHRDSVCGRFRATRRFRLPGQNRDYPAHQRARMAAVDRFRWLPRSAQCEHCARTVASAVEPRHILSVSLFCAALVREPTPVLRTLIRSVCLGEEGAAMVAMDMAAEQGLDKPWPIGVEKGGVEWPRIERHEHVWLPYVNGLTTGVAYPGLLRCPCGVVTTLAGRVSTCQMQRCQRERGHPGQHMARSWDARASLEIVDEWGDFEPMFGEHEGL